MLKDALFAELHVHVEVKDMEIQPGFKPGCSKCPSDALPS